MKNFIFIIIAALLYPACKEKERSIEAEILEQEEGMDTAEILTADTMPPKKFIIEQKAVREGWAEVINDSLTILDIRYATENNFVDEVLYECGKCYLREAAADALERVASDLQSLGLGMVIYDCYRPKPIQQRLWDKVPNASYVTPPSRGSMHNRGVAIDLGLIDMKGQYLEMGTEYDYFGREGHHDYYDHPQEVLDNRTLLKTTMEKYGFASIRTEWWHYSYPIGSYEIADWQWDCQ